MIRSEEKGRKPPDRRPDPTRREFVALGVGAFVVAAAPGLLRRGPRLVRRRIPVMGTLAEVAVVHRDPTYAQGAVDAALDELRAVERTMTRFRDDSEIGRVNRMAWRRPVEVGPGTASVLEESLAWARASDGGFDPCLGGAMELWAPEDRTAPPDPESVRRWAGRGLWQALELERSGSRVAVRLLDRDASVDLGGIAKGYGVDRAAEALRRWGVRNALVNAGGDLWALGTSQDGDPWKVGIRDPDDPSGLVTTLRVTDRAVATSGDYQRFFAHGGRRYHHLLDPGSGEPREGSVHSVTVEASSCMTADAAATAVFGSDPDQARRLIVAAGRDARVVHQV